MMRRVLLFYTHWPPATAGGSVRLVKAAKWLRRCGWSVDVVTVADRRADFYDKYDHRLQDEVPPEVRVIEVPAAPAPRSISRWPVPEPLAAWAPAAYRAALARCRDTAYDLLWASAPSFASFAAARWTSLATGIPWVAEYRDPWTVSPLFPGSDLPAARACERQHLASANRVNCLSEGWRSGLVEAFPESASKMSVLQNAFDPDDYAGEAEEPGAEARLRVLHVGHIYPFKSDARMVIQGAAQARSAGPSLPIEMVFVGKCPQIEPLAREYEVSDMVRCEGVRPHRECVAHLRRADVILVIAPHVDTDRYFLTKACEAFGAGKPILAVRAGGAWKRLIHECGTATLAETPQQVAEALADFAAQRRRGPLTARAPREIEAAFSWETRARELAALFDEAIHD